MTSEASEWYQIGPNWSTSDPLINLVSFRTFRCPYSPNQFLFFGASYSKTALQWSSIDWHNLRQIFKLTPNEGTTKFCQLKIVQSTVLKTNALYQRWIKLPLLYWLCLLSQNRNSNLGRPSYQIKLHTLKDSRSFEFVVFVWSEKAGKINIELYNLWKPPVWFHPSSGEAGQPDEGPGFCLI